LSKVKDSKLEVTESITERIPPEKLREEFMGES